MNHFSVNYYAKYKAVLAPKTRKNNKINNHFRETSKIMYVLYFNYKYHSPSNPHTSTDQRTAIQLKSVRAESRFNHNICKYLRLDTV